MLLRMEKVSAELNNAEDEREGQHREPSDPGAAASSALVSCFGWTAGAHMCSFKFLGSISM